MKKIAYILLFIFFPLMLRAQTDSLKVCTCFFKGKIVDSKTHSSLPYAALFIHELNSGTSANEYGSYEFNNICPGEYTLSISIVGYKPLIIKVNVSHNLKKEFALEEENFQLKEVTIEGHKEKEGIQIKNSLTGLALQNTRGSSLAGSLQSLPGVNMIQTGPSIAKPVIHGLHSNRILILNNGVRLEGQQWGSEHAPEIDPFVASQLSVIKGAASVQYGSDAIGGVIMVQPKDLPKEPGINGELNLVGISNGREGIASGIVEGTIKKIKGFSFRAQTTYKKGGNVKTPDYYLKNTGSRELNFSGALGYHKGNFGTDVFFSRFDTKLGIFTGSHIGNITDLEARINAKRPLVSSGFSYSIGRPYQEVNHNLLKINTHYYFNNAGRLNMVYALQNNSRKEFDAHKPRNDSLAALNRPEVNFELTTQTAELIFEHKQLGNFSGSIGLTGMKQVNVFIPLTRRLIPNFRSYNGGAFIIERYTRKKFELEAGVRYDYKWFKTFDRIRAGYPVVSHLYNFNNITGTFGGFYKIDHHLTVRANIGSSWRPPSINELFFYGRHHGSGRFIKGDSGLVSESAYNFSTTIGFKGHGFDIEVSPYLNYINNYIYLKPETENNSETGEVQHKYEQTISGAYPSFVYTQANAGFKGLDLSLEYTFAKKITFHSTSSFVRVKDRNTKQYIEYIPADRFQNTLSYKFKDLVWIKEPGISITNVYVCKQFRVPNNTDFLAPPDAYFLFNSNVNFSIMIGRQKADIGFSINNILNMRYRDYLDAFRYYSDSPGRSFILRLKIPFNIINITNN